MEISPDKTADLKVKHLEMIQTIIARMSGQSATLKNYSITVTTAVCGLAVALQKPILALLALLPVLAFALLDAQYLRRERQFRALFNRVRLQDRPHMTTFEIDRSIGAVSGRPW
jgi:hypothetical protein